jgi:hypothetical protein|tara:strand:+ start:63 stop:674 length:612 start_codon:yes stop_codon:yes gene_type:complete
MNRSLIVVVPILLLGFAVAGELEIGSGIPMGNVKMTDVSGREVSLNDAMGEKGLLVIFSCNTCPWVNAWEDRYIVISERYGKKGVGIIALNPNAARRGDGDGLADMQERAAKAGYAFHYALDEGAQLASAFGATRTPHIYLFSKEGKLVYRGAIDDNARKPRKVKKPYLMNAIDAMLAGEKVEVNSSKALGCGIKFPEKPIKL